MFKLIAKVFAIPAVTDYIRNVAANMPDEFLHGYMNRYWLFNPYNRITRKTKYPWCPISIRVHHILRQDMGRHQHDHPWNARTFILRGWYVEKRGDIEIFREAGDTASLKFNEYHEITRVSPGGVWTLFVMGRFQGNWGFKVNGKKVKHDHYLGEQ